LKVQIISYENYPKIIEKLWFSWNTEFQHWFVEQNPKNILKIPRKKLIPELAQKYKYLLSMGKAGIF